MWLEWKRRTDKEHYLDPKRREEINMKVSIQMANEGLIQREQYTEQSIAMA